MDVHKRTVNEIFNPAVRLEAPLFQRPYVWKEEDNWQPLWEYIQKAAERRLANQPLRPHFLGNVVLDQARVPTGAMPTRYIIDGQQRLTTLQLLLAALRDLCNAWHADGYQRVFARLTANDTPQRGNPDKEFKVWPTNQDREAFNAVMGATPPIDYDAIGHRGERMVEAHRLEQLGQQRCVVAVAHADQVNVGVG